MIARLSAFVIWALVATATVFWGMRLVVRADPVPANAVVVSDATHLSGDFSRLLGAEPVTAVAAAPQISSRFRLIGVVAGRPGQEGATPGVALISIDGKPARAFKAGARIEDELLLQDVSMRSASIGKQGGAPFVLEIPLLPPPATGVLPQMVLQQASPSPPPPLPPPPAPNVVQRQPAAGAAQRPPGSSPRQRVPRPGFVASAATR